MVVLKDGPRTKSLTRTDDISIPKPDPNPNHNPNLTLNLTLSLSRNYVFNFSPR